MPTFQQNLIFLHSILRYFILLFALIVVVQSLVGMTGKRQFNKSNKQIALVLLICCDLQLLLGLILYFTRGWFDALKGSNAMKDPYTRFYAMEHSVGMILAIVLVHVGYSAIKKNIEAARKFNRLFWCVFAALIIFLAMIPWESKQLVGRPNIPSMHMPS
jgi:hypothetical protein